MLPTYAIGGGGEQRYTYVQRETKILNRQQSPPITLPVPLLFFS